MESSGDGEGLMVQLYTGELIWFTLTIKIISVLPYETLFDENDDKWNED